MTSHTSHVRPSPTQRVWVIGDVHGDLEATRRALMAAGVAEKAEAEAGGLRWVGGDSIVVMCGDVLDGCPRSFDSTKRDRSNAFAPGAEAAMLDSLATLKEGAREAGGRLVTLVGNHELMNAQGNFSHVHPVEKQNYDCELKLRTARRELVQRFLDQRDVFVVLKICNVMFVHGGLTQGIVAGLRQMIHGDNVADDPLDRVNALALGALRRRNQGGEEGNTALPDAVFGPDGLLWTRRQTHGGTAEELDQIFEGINAMLSANANANANANADVDTLVVGHTVQGYDDDDDDDDDDGEFDAFAASTPPHHFPPVATLDELLESNRNWATLREHLRGRVGSAVALRMRRRDGGGHRLICADVGMSAAFRHEPEPEPRLHWPCALLLEPREDEDGSPVLAPKEVRAWVEAEPEAKAKAKAKSAKAAPAAWAASASARWMHMLRRRRPSAPEQRPAGELPLKSLYRHFVKWFDLGTQTRTEQMRMAKDELLALLTRRRALCASEDFVTLMRDRWEKARAADDPDAFAQLAVLLRAERADGLRRDESPPWQDAMFVCVEPGMGRGVMAFRDIPKGLTIKIDSKAFEIKDESAMTDDERRYAWGERVFKDHERDHPAIMMNEAPRKNETGTETGTGKQQKQQKQLADAYVVHDDRGEISIEFLRDVRAFTYVHTYYNATDYPRDYAIDRAALDAQFKRYQERNGGGAGATAARRRKPQRRQPREWDESLDPRFDFYNTAYKSGLGQGKLEIFDTEAHGKGVRALVALPANAILTKYEGSLVDAEQLDNLSDSQRAYVAALPPGRGAWCAVLGLRFDEIQARRKGAGLGSLVNDPRGSDRAANCATYSPQMGPKNPSLYIVSTREIEPGEELLLNYGDGGGLQGMYPTLAAAPGIGHSINHHERAAARRRRR